MAGCGLQAPLLFHQHPKCHQIGGTYPEASQKAQKMETLTIEGAACSCAPASSPFFFHPYSLLHIPHERFTVSLYFRSVLLTGFQSRVSKPHPQLMGWRRTSVSQNLLLCSFFSFLTPQRIQLLGGIFLVWFGSWEGSCLIEKVSQLSLWFPQTKPVIQSFEPSSWPEHLDSICLFVGDNE